MELLTSYLGLNLKNPIVVSASPLSMDLDNIRRMEDAGAGAVVMYSLFEEQINHESREIDHYLSYGSESYGESLTYFPDLATYNVGPDGYLEKIRLAKSAVDIPVIGSLNGVSRGGWVEYASRIQQAGADALELNIYYIPTSVDVAGQEIEGMYLDVVKAVKESVSIPVSVKLSPFFSAMASMARRFEEVGAKGLVLFNRFYQPDIDLEQLEVVPNLVLSESYELRLPLRWVAILYGRVALDLAITSGIHNHEDVLKGVMAGASVTMMTSELLKNGIFRIGTILRDLERWGAEHEYASIEQMRGSISQKNVANPAAFERANYMKVLQSWTPDPTSRLER
ncbi:MAG: dihydroorotate dehydrogenase-like protein [Deltaproteobacteria bacterium]|nr:dihydroorotate dehydrogenase-like protein [Deltaproteobacteria bacterium]